jgi:putative membrane protein
MKRSLSLTSAALLALLGATPAVAQMSPAKASTVDLSFATTAAEDGMAEVADAKLALAKSKNPSVDAFARRMVHDHTQANDKLLAILQKQNIPAPAGVGETNASMHQKLLSLKGGVFDENYLNQQKAAHLATIALFEREASAGTDPALVSFAKATLPTLHEHLAMVEKISAA